MIDDGACNNARKYKEKYVIKPHISALTLLDPSRLCLLWPGSRQFDKSGTNQYIYPKHCTHAHKHFNTHSSKKKINITLIMPQ